MQPIQLTALKPRGSAEARDLAIAVQANLVQLKVAESRRAGHDSALHEIQVSSPGPVSRRRDALIDPEIIAAYTDLELRLRSHEVWGQFCLSCWFFHGDDPNHPPRFATLPDTTPVRCPGTLAAKTREVELCLWRLRFEQRHRLDPMFKDSPGFSELYRRAADIPVMVLGQNVRVCDANSLLLGSCEFAGMLAACRWLGDTRWTWGQEGLMDLPGQPAV